MLARTQSQSVADSLQKAHPGLTVELKIISTSGDRMVDRPLAEAGGKGLFTKELELALLAGEVDFAVHSMKDVPVTMPLVDQADLILAAVPQREDARDALVSQKARTLADLPAGAVVGTGSVRRRCQILQARPDVVVKPLRGNVDTRLRKLHDGEYDAVVIAVAGLKRLKFFDATWMHPIELNVLLPAAAQGALALQCRKSDPQTAEILWVLHDTDTADAVAAEREVVAALNGDCDSPIAAFAMFEGQTLTLMARLGQKGGQPPVAHAKAVTPRTLWRQSVQKVAQTLQASLPNI
jgi:hydroxymethylbilane synthase